MTEPTTSTALDPELVVLHERLEQVALDLTEIDEQLAVGELDPTTAERLRASYEAERARIVEAIARFSPTVPRARSRRRAVVGTVLMLGAFAVVAIAAWQALAPRAGGFITGDVGVTDAPRDLSEVTNDEMEAVIAANADHPQVNGMRLALADRYFAAGEFSDALRHYTAVLDGDPSPDEAAVALARIGWMLYRSGAADEAAAFLERALATNPNLLEAHLFYGFVLLDGLGDPAAALPHLDKVAASGEVPENLRAEVDRAIAEAREAVGG